MFYGLREISANFSNEMWQMLLLFLKNFLFVVTLFGHSFCEMSADLYHYMVNNVITVFMC